MSENKTSNDSRQQKLASATVIVCALMLLLAAIGTINIAQNRAQQMRKSSEPGQSSYVNIILLFGPIESDISDEFYIAADTDQRLHIVRLDADAFEACSEIYDYSNQRGDFEHMPKSVRVTGVAAATETETKRRATSLFNTLSRTELVTEENFREYFGETYLDATRTGTSPGYYFLYAAAALAVFAVILLVAYFVNRKKQPRLESAEGKE